MAYEIKLEHRTAQIELLNRAGSKVLLAVDDRKYELDIVMVEKCVYSILYHGHSYNVELIEGESSKEYIVNTFARSFIAEIIDAETRYQQNRKLGTKAEGDNNISSPMPGKIVKLLVQGGDQGQEGQTLLVMEAMKMQNELKTSTTGTVKTVHVQEGATVETGTALITVVAPEV